MEIPIVNQSHHPLPTYATLGASGMDLRAFTAAPIWLAAGQRILIATGIAIALPKGYEAQVRPRSGLALHHGITVLNSPGTIDADYRGEIKVLLINLSDQRFLVEDGDRIAQLVVTKYESVGWKVVPALDQTARGVGGHGSTGHH
ncbi:MAG: dUTP diphosphatase [Candidatus Cardinium sp.]|uniref:dUTP diphosphatase n=1 Tax=Cardinium endosymbiont of Dermatophagoides farinae TaxID=2597823 RepID=UPI001183CA96|nr:dUTP diphosphatase [Cardinium endosymbiont of Dermatophagoides farinae]TSJ81090.1 dUTP diphosphatase [Cardinium endosymbiont of Dermatophagoides farinae]UWW97129.1 MAG: dUTP diphosphatase [Candidatus Cardinium sp.]